MHYADNVHQLTHNLPSPPTPFIGRDAELAAVSELLDNPECRLLTLVGPGGIGKTRLCIEAATRRQAAFADGVWFVPLEPVQSADFLVPAIAHTLQLAFSGHEPVEAQLLDFLADRQALVILDNFEQLLPTLGEVLLSRILAHAPRVRLLVTSREILNLQEEWLYPVQGMAFPDARVLQADAEQVALFSAAQLFIERAQRVRRDFDGDGEQACIARICQLVEGMPLALELAATWVKTLPCATIADEISRNLDFLETSLRNIPDRHRSMQAVFEHSWANLTPEEQAVFARLSVFRGGFRREAAEAVAGASLRLLSALVDKSMLRVTANGRYTFHELLRQYAGEHLDKTLNATADVSQAHAAYYADLLASQLTDLVSGRQSEVLHQLQAEDDNIRLAWQTIINHGWIPLLAQAAEPLALLYRYQSRHSESRRAFEKALICFDQSPTPPPGTLRLVVLMTLVWADIRLGRLDDAERMVDACLQLSRDLDTLPVSGYAANPLVPLAGIALFRGDYARALQVAQQALDFSHERQQPSSQYRALYVLTRASRGLGRYGDARAYAEQTHATARDLNDPWFVAYGLSELGSSALEAGDDAKAQAYFEDTYALRRKIDDPEGMARALSALGGLHLHRGEYDDAEARFQESRHGFQKIRDAEGMAAVLHGLARVALQRGHSEEAQRYYQQALDIVAGIAAAPAAFPLLADVGGLLLDNGMTERAVRILLLVAHHPYAAHADRERATRLLKPYPVTFAGLDAYPLAQAIADSRSALHELVTGATSTTSADGVDWSAQELIALLSEREREVLRLLADALSNQEIADRLFVGVSTVKKHINHIYAKLGISNRIQAMHLAQKLPPEV